MNSTDLEPTGDRADGPTVYPQPYHPVPDPGIEHVQRFTDAYPPAGRRAYAQVVGMLALVPLLAIGFIVIYFAVPRGDYIKLGPLYANALNVGLSVTGGLMVALIGFAAIHWAKQLMGDEESIDYRHPMVSTPEERAEFLGMVDAGIKQSNLGRRRLIGVALLGALGVVGAPAIVLLSDMGPYATPSRIRNTIEKTVWAEGVRLVNDITYTPIKATDLEIGQLVNGEPEVIAHLSGEKKLQEIAKAAIVVVRMDPKSIKIPASRQNWQVGGILAYSKICTHVGCPISLWERTTHHLLCPCHQSTFDLGDSGVVVFGPAHRSLPQLPITVDSEGYLVARSDFTVPVGPSFFERDSRHDFQKGDN
ncbi:MAG TPA: Rieske 2Fe-2S domain-containing protein [Propionibacteriaceae bacterium]|nr:Rieske 2Fe-2S domain-containing protein [Propionibacteriaceae bacterium]